MKRLRYIGTFPQEVMPHPGAETGTVRSSGDEFEVADDKIADDLLRRKEYFEEVQERPQRLRAVPAPEPKEE